MSNNILTHQMIAREAAVMIKEKLPFFSNVSKTREDDVNAKVNGYRKGGSVKVRVQPSSKVYDGATFAGGGSADDQVESYVNLTLSTQKHVPLTFTAVEKALSLDEFRERFLLPATAHLAAVVQADMLAKTYYQIPNLVGSAGSVPTTSKTYSQAAAVLDKFLAPPEPRPLLFSSDANVELVDASKSLFNPNPELSKMFRTGFFGDFGGMNFFTCQSLPVHTNGSKVASVTVNGASQTGSTLSIKGLTSGDTFKKGSVFTIAGLYSVNPLTGESTGALRQFTILADATATGATLDLSICPAIDATMPGKTVTATAADGAAITFSGAASTGYRQNILWQRDAIATALAPLPILAGCEGYTFDADGIALRIMTFGDGKADVEHTRIDVLYADPKLIRPDHACRITE